MESWGIKVVRFYHFLCVLPWTVWLQPVWRLVGWIGNKTKKPHLGHTPTATASIKYSSDHVTPLHPTEPEGFPIIPVWTPATTMLFRLPNNRTRFYNSTQELFSLSERTPPMHHYRSLDDLHPLSESDPELWREVYGFIPVCLERPQQ